MSSDPKPRLVLHVCCAPDEAWVVHSLRDRYELHSFFCNPNIAPPDEYDTRVAEAQSVADRYGVAFSAPPYNPQEWEQAVALHLHTPEGGERCRACYGLRLGATARFCRDLGWPAFTTVMSISPQKKVSLLHEVGAEAAAEFGVRFEPFNFRKKNGFEDSIKLSESLGLYRQDYCGCRLSLKERQERRAKAKGGSP
jgi:predicted adenine nucleotide alpha hydrolase (AANH) superfamily ATPase